MFIFIFVGIVKVSSVLRTNEGFNSSSKHSGVEGHDNLTFSPSYFLGLFGFAVAFVSVVHGLVVLSSVRVSQFPWTQRLLGNWKLSLTGAISSSTRAIPIVASYTFSRPRFAQERRIVELAILQRERLTGM